MKPADIVSKVRVDGQKEYFGFASIDIFDGGNLFKEPWVIVRIAIYDRDSKKVLDLAGRGVGESNFLVSNRGAANLEVALTRAFDGLKSIAVEPL